jgi:hypothetical protein
LIECEGYKSDRRKEAEKSEDSADARDALEQAHLTFFEVYGVVQAVAERRVVDAARIYAYRLWELKEELDSNGVLGPESFDRMAELVRDARHGVIDAIQRDLGLPGSAEPEEVVNPFLGTDLGDSYARSSRRRPGSGRSSVAR